MHLFLHIIIFSVGFFLYLTLEYSLNATNPWFEGIRWWNTFHFFEERAAHIMRLDHPVYFFFTKRKWFRRSSRLMVVKSLKNPVMYGKKPMYALVKLLQNATGQVRPTPKFRRTSYTKRSWWFTIRSTNIFNPYSYAYLRSFLLTPKYKIAHARVRRLFRSVFFRKSPEFLIKNLFSFRYWYNRSRKNKTIISRTRFKFLKIDFAFKVAKFHRWPHSGRFRKIKSALFSFNSKYYNVARRNYSRKPGSFPPRVDRMLYNFYLDRVVLNQPKFKFYCFNRNQSKYSGRIFP